MKQTIKRLMWSPIILILATVIGLTFGNDIGLTGYKSVIAAFLICAFITHTIVSFRKKKIQESVTLHNLRSSSDLLNDIQFRANYNKFVLFLRPFGNDGSVKRYTTTDFMNLSTSVNLVEEKICERIERVFGCRVFALADQNLSKVPNSPEYYLCDHASWELHVEKLLKRCLFAVVYIPSSTGIRNSLRWEIFTALFSGLRSRLLVVYPDHWVNSENTIVKQLKDQLSFIEGVSQLDHRSIGFIMYRGCICKEYILDSVKGLKRLVISNNYENAAANLELFLPDMMEMMKENISNIPAKYVNAFIDTEILNYDLDLTDKKIKLIYEAKEGTFDFMQL